MKALLTTLALSLLCLCAARADVEVSSSSDQVWIATDAQIAALDKKPVAGEDKLKREALAFAKKTTRVRDWEAPGCEKFEIEGAPGKSFFWITLIRPDIKTVDDGMMVLVLQDGTVLTPKKK